MALSQRKEAQVKAYVTQARDHGFSLSTIEAKLRMAGYKAADLAQITRAFASPERDTPTVANRKFFGMLFIISIMVGVVVLGWYFAADTCAAESCFTAAANRCSTATFESETDGTRMRHAVDNCRYTRTMLTISDNEPEAVQQLFAGKSMECPYAEGGFNPDWLNTVSIGLEGCAGELKDAITAVINAQEELGII